MLYRILPIILTLLVAAPAAAGPGDFDDARALARKLSLSPEQQAKVRAIQDALRKSQAKVRAEIEVTSIDLRRELEKDSPDEGKVGKLVEKVAQLEGALRKEHIVSTIRIKKLLDKDQRARLEGMQGHTMPMPPTAVAPVVPPTPPTPPTPVFGDDDDDDFDFDFDFDFDPDDFDAVLTPEMRKEIERELANAQREIEKAKREAMKARGQALREAQRAMEEAKRAQRDAQREVRRALERAQRDYNRNVHRNHSSNHDSDGTVIINQTNHGTKGDGVLNINAGKPAELYIDGKKIGVTPLQKALRPGRHKIEARWTDGKRKHLTVVINDGDTVDVIVRPPN